jgi:iron uptake system component EfeO
VTAEDRACTVARTDLAAGPVSFAVTNKGSSVTEVYVYGRDGDEYDKIVAEVENIGPGTSRDLEATLSAGSYEIACKPGQQGDGIRSRVTVTGDAPPASAGGGSAGEPAHDREIELSTDGRTLTGLPADAPRGQRVEFKLENRAGAARTLEVRDPAGAVAGEVDVDPGSAGETVVGLGAAGDWRLVVEGDGVDDVVGTLPVR